MSGLDDARESSETLSKEELRKLYDQECPGGHSLSGPITFVDWLNIRETERIHKETGSLGQMSQRQQKEKKS